MFREVLCDKPDFTARVSSAYVPGFERCTMRWRSLVYPVLALLMTLISVLTLLMVLIPVLTLLMALIPVLTC